MTFSGHFFAICMLIFHKTEVLTVILRCLTGLAYDWIKHYDIKCKYFHFFFCVWFCTKTYVCIFCVFCIFVLFVITFVPIKVLTCWAPQNDRLNLSFVKDKHVVTKKTARYGLKMAIDQLLLFGSTPNFHEASGYMRP